MRAKRTTDRLAQVTAACDDEHVRLAIALAQGRKPILDTAFGRYLVISVYGFDVQACPENSRPDWLNTRTFMIANDDRWESILKQAGVTRNPLFA